MDNEQYKLTYNYQQCHSYSKRDPTLKKLIMQLNWPPDTSRYLFQDVMWNKDNTTFRTDLKICSLDQDKTVGSSFQFMCFQEGQWCLIIIIIIGLHMHSHFFKDNSSIQMLPI